MASWIDELNPESRRRVVDSAGSEPRPAELKKAAVLELCTREGSAKAIADKLGVSRPTLYNWKNQLAGPEVTASMKRQKDLPADQDAERAELERQVEALRHDIRRMQLEHDLLKNASELIRKGLGVSPQLLTNREKALLVDVLKQTYVLSDLLTEVGLARSSYFYHWTRLQVADKYAGAR